MTASLADADADADVDADADADAVAVGGVSARTAGGGTGGATSAALPGRVSRTVFRRGDVGRPPDSYTAWAHHDVHVTMRLAGSDGDNDVVVAISR